MKRDPTIRDVAARAGVSKSLVSRVLSGSKSVSDRRREAVLKAIDELGYRPNAAARTLVQRRSKTIGVLVTDLRNPFFVEIIGGIEPVAEEREYTVLVLSGKHQRETEHAALNKLLELRVDGVICDAARLDRQTLRAAAQRTPLVSLTRTPVLARMDSVVTDDRLGATLAVAHLADLGHRRIAMIADAQERAGADRIRGYEEAMVARGLADERMIAPGGFTETGGYWGALELLERKPRPTAIFAANDFSALGVLDAAAALGLDVPRDVSVVGYDDISFAAFRRVALSTVHQPATEIGKAAIDALLTRMDKVDRPARHVVMRPVLVPRATTGPPPRPQSGRG